MTLIQVLVFLPTLTRLLPIQSLNSVIFRTRYLTSFDLPLTSFPVLHKSPEQHSHSPKFLDLDPHIWRKPSIAAQPMVQQ